MMHRSELRAHSVHGTGSACTVERLAAWAAGQGLEALAIADYRSTLAASEISRLLPEIRKRENPLKLVIGTVLTIHDDSETMDGFDIVLLARNAAGFRNLNGLLSASGTDRGTKSARLVRRDIQDRREGLLVGASSFRGEFSHPGTGQYGDTELESRIGFYDYIEILPPVFGPDFTDPASLIRIADRLGVPAVAVGDQRAVDEADLLALKILYENQVFKSSAYPLEGFRNGRPGIGWTTGAMLKAMSFLGARTAYRIVVENPRTIASRIESFDPMEEGGSEQQSAPIRETALDGMLREALVRYGNPPPPEVTERLRNELGWIGRNRLAAGIEWVWNLSSAARQDGLPLELGGVLGGTLAASLLGLTEVNPLATHILCPACRKAWFPSSPEYRKAADLVCPICGGPCRDEGDDLPWALFPESINAIESLLKVRGPLDCIPPLVERLRECDGVQEVFRVLGQYRIGYIHAYHLVSRIPAEEDFCRDPLLDAFDIDDVIERVAAMSSSMRVHPKRLAVVPSGVNPHGLSPIYQTVSGHQALLMDAVAANGTPTRMDVERDLSLTLVHDLMLRTGVEPGDLRSAGTDPIAISLFESEQALGIDLSALGCHVGTLGIPVFGSRSARKVLKEYPVYDFPDLVGMCGVLDGFWVYPDSRVEFIRHLSDRAEGIAATVEDAHRCLVQHGVAPAQALDLIRLIRRGVARTDEESEELGMSLRSIRWPSWMAEFYLSINSLMGKAAAIQQARRVLALAWFKIHSPEAYYRSVLGRCPGFGTREIGLVRKGPQAILDELRRTSLVQTSGQVNGKREALAIAYEMILRGVEIDGEKDEWSAACRQGKGKVYRAELGKSPATNRRVQNLPEAL